MGTEAEMTTGGAIRWSDRDIAQQGVKGMERWNLREEGEAEQRDERGGEGGWGPSQRRDDSRAEGFRAAVSPEVLPQWPSSRGRSSDSPAAGLSEPRLPRTPSLLARSQAQGSGAPPSPPHPLGPGSRFL